MDVQGLRNLTLKEIADIDDGRIGEAFNQALRRVATDMDDRPGDKRPRKVTIELACIPVVDERGFCDAVQMQAQIKDSIPTRKSKVYDLGLRKGGLMVFQPLALDNHRQTTIEMPDDDE